MPCEFEKEHEITLKLTVILEKMKAIGRKYIYTTSDWA